MRQCYQEPVNESNNIGTESRKDLRIEEEVMEEEEEDTLSLCDLPICDIDSEKWEKYYDSKSTSSSTSSSSSDDQDLFEFISEEWNKNASLSSHHAPENILFCGKLIPCRNPVMLENTKKDANEVKMREKRSFSSLKSSSRLFFFLFGMAGIPTEMNLKDLKNRQSRKVTSSSPSSALSPLRNGDEKAIASHYKHGRGKGKGMWGLIKSLSCTGGASYQAQSVVKASIGCISLV